jgi:hypothetical protein
MRFLWRSGVVLCALFPAMAALAATAACTVERTPDAAPSRAPSASGPPVRPCPWSEERGQDYEPETGRIRLTVTGLAEPHVTADGRGWVYSGPDQNRSGGHRYADGTTVAVLCVEAAGGRFADSANDASTVWFRIVGSFADGENDVTGWVPHAATGYASTYGQDTCSPGDRSGSSGPATG